MNRGHLGIKKRNHFGAMAVRARRKRIVSILEEQGTPMTQRQIHQALRLTPNVTGYKSLGGDLRIMNEVRDGTREVWREQLGHQPILWSVRQLRHPEAPKEPYMPESNIGKVLTFELPLRANPAPVVKVWVCHHKLRRGECAMCVNQSGETK